MQIRVSGHDQIWARKYRTNHGSKVFLQSVHVGSLIYNPEEQTFVYESKGGNRTVLMQGDETLAKLALCKEFDK